jgi:hypothetical protein
MAVRNGIKIYNDELKMWREAVTAYTQVCYMPGDVKENNKKLLNLKNSLLE